MSCFLHEGRENDSHLDWCECQDQPCQRLCRDGGQTHATESNSWSNSLHHYMHAFFENFISQGGGKPGLKASVYPIL